MVETIRHGRGTARILFEGRSFVLPASSPYDLELLLDHSRYLASRHGGVKIQLSGQTWLVSPAQKEPAPVCADCGEIEASEFRCSGISLCESCSTERMLEDSRQPKAA